ncbi:MAG: procyclic acidic repetitive family protein [Myxococcales bacterium]|nr:procyclic acidic repetitive family protein [Myxococcales bacterium]
MTRKVFFSLFLFGALVALGVSSACVTNPSAEQQAEKSAETAQEISKEPTPTEVTPEPIAEAAQDATQDAAEAMNEPQPESQPEPVVETQPEPQAEPQPETTPEPVAEPNPEPTQEVVVESTCQTASDCPNDPPPIKCLGAHWECVSNQCTPTCGDPKTCDALERYIKENMDSVATCQEDATCQMDTLGTCPFGCYIAKEWTSDDDEVRRLVDLYKKDATCQKCTYRCAPQTSLSVHCEHKKRCVVVSDITCNAIKDQQSCIQNDKCRAVIGPSCPVCSDFGFQRCVPIETSGCVKQITRARPFPAASACTTFASPCNVPHGWTLCP